MELNRREFLLFLSAAVGTVEINSLARKRHLPLPFQPDTTSVAAISAGVDEFRFQPIQGPMPLETSGIRLSKELENFRHYDVVDDLVLPSGFTYDMIAAWGDRVGDSRFGYNNDYLSLVETSPGAGYLTVNFEYISAIPWLQSYETVIGKSLPFKDVEAALKAAAGDKGIDAYALPDRDPLKAKILAICQEALVDQGMGVISLRKTATGQWERTYSATDRRITGISGLKDGRYLTCTGPAKAVFRKTSGQGYLDALGDRIIGTFGNCAGGTTPWGTTLSGEENIQSQVPEAVYADGTAFSPSQRPFTINDEDVSGQGNVLGLAGNKYGWIVEVDPANPNDYGTKHTWLGRYRHEAVGVRVVAGQPLAFYSGCDRRGGHLYKFVSRDRVTKPTDKANSRLLEHGMLYAAKFNPDGTGRWLALKADTPVNPDRPDSVVGGMIPLPKRPQGGYFRAKSTEEITQFKQQFKTLGDLYSGSAEEQQGAILIDAHYAANACGATCTARPEDTEIAPDGSLYITFTSGTSGSDGGPDRQIFKGAQGEVPYEYGFIMRLVEENNEPAAMNFRWTMMALGGEPAEGGAGFANPDNLLIDARGNVWMVTDMSSDKLNKAISAETSAANNSGKGAVSQPDRRGAFGNNSMWFIPTSGENAGKAYLFALGPIECETTGPFFTPDQQTLFLSVQHPGETHGIRHDQQSELRTYVMKTPDGQEFTQTRQVPIGSNWPTGKVNAPPKPAVVAIRRRDRLGSEATRNGFAASERDEG